jgi:hypothetical protein
MAVYDPCVFLMPCSALVLNGFDSASKPVFGRSRQENKRERK